MNKNNKKRRKKERHWSIYDYYIIAGSQEDSSFDYRVSVDLIAYITQHGAIEYELKQMVGNPIVEDNESRGHHISQIKI